MYRPAAAFSSRKNSRLTARRRRQRGRFLPPPDPVQIPSAPRSASVACQIPSPPIPPARTRPPSLPNRAPHLVRAPNRPQITKSQTLARNSRGRQCSCGMGRKSKRTSAPAPMEIPQGAQSVPPAGSQAVPPPGAQPIPLQGAQLVPPLGFASMVRPGTWFAPSPPQSMAASSTPCWLAGSRLPGLSSPLTQGPWWAPPSSVQATASPWAVAENADDADIQAWYMVCNVVFELNKL